MEIEEKLKAVGEKIRLLRLNQDLPQKEVAHRMGISQACLSNIEAGRCASTLRNLFALQEVYGCKMADFFVDVELEKAQEAPKLDTELKLEDLYDLLALLKQKKRI